MDRISLATYLSYKRYEITSTKKIQAAESQVVTAQLLFKSSRIFRNSLFNTVHTNARHFPLSSTRQIKSTPCHQMFTTYFNITLHSISTPFTLPFCFRFSNSVYISITFDRFLKTHLCH